MDRKKTGHSNTYHGYPGTVFGSGVNLRPSGTQHGHDDHTNTHHHAGPAHEHHHDSRSGDPHSRHHGHDQSHSEHQHYSGFTK